MRPSAAFRCWNAGNNDVEGLHNRLNRRAKKGNLPFYMLLSLLYSEACVIPTQVKMVKEGKLRRYQHKHTKGVSAKVAKLWERYADTSSLLKRCGRLYGPC